MALGIGTQAESLLDTSLQLESARAPILLTTYDFANNKLVYKASIPDDYVGKIYEVGLYSLEENTASGEYGSRLITTFDSATEPWVNTADGLPAAFGTASTRIGIDSLFHNPGASISRTASLGNIQLDFSGNSGTDAFIFAYNVGTANTSQITFKFMTDASNYYTFSMGSQTGGYKIVSDNKSTAAVTGSPSWSNITEIQVTTSSGAGGASSVEFDAIRIEDKDVINLDYVLVARKVLGAPATKVDGVPQDIEYSLDVVV